MADFDSKLPTRGLAVDNTTEIADSAGTTINPAKEDGNLASIKTDLDEIATDTDKLDVNLSTRLADSTFTGRINTLGQKTMANSTPVVIASDQSTISMNEAQVSGTAVSVNTGNSDAGTQRVVLASNQPTVAVSFSSTTVELPQYNTSAALAAAASNTQTYSPGSTVNLDGVDASASGQMKIEIQYGTTGAETTKAVFFTSKGNLQLMWRLPNPISITNTMSVKVIRTNMDNQAMDVYSTILVH